MTISVNGYDHQNYPQRNLKANNPSFGMAHIHKSVAKKVAKAREATPEVQETVQKLSKKIFDSKLPHVLTGSLFGAYYLKNKETGAKIEVDASSKKQGTTIVDTLSDTNKKLMIMEVFGTEDNELVQKITKDEYISRNLSNLYKISKGEHSEILSDLTSKAFSVDYMGKAAADSLTVAKVENIKYVPEVMSLVNKENYKVVENVVSIMTEENKEIVLDLFRQAQKNTLEGEAARKILSYAHSEQIKYAPEVMSLVNEVNSCRAGNAVNKMTEENKEIVLDLFRQAQKNTHEGEVANRILEVARPEQMKCIPFLNISEIF